MKNFVMKKLFSVLFALSLFGSLLVSSDAVAQNETVGSYASMMQGQAPIPVGNFGLIAKYADRFLNTGPGGARTVYTKPLLDGVDKLDVVDEITDYFVLDIRKPADFCAGHIDGAVNIQYADIAKPESLALLPLDKPILIVCYTGHTASVANGILGALGYDAWTLRFGMSSWNASTKNGVWDPDAKQIFTGADYQTVKCPPPILE